MNIDKAKIVQKFKDKFFPTKKRNLSPEECLQFQEINRLVNSSKYQVEQIKNNTALIPRGKELALESEAVTRVLENSLNLFVSQTLINCGYKPNDKVSINLQTGAITYE